MRHLVLFKLTLWLVKAKPISALNKFLSKKRTITIVTHWSPDGDAIGSSLGLWNYLRKCGHNATVVVPNEYPEFLHWMNGHSKVIDHMKEGKKANKAVADAEIIFCLDFNDLKRINSLGQFVEKNPCPKVMIDHHPEPSVFAEYALHDVKASSTAELIYNFIALHKGLKKIDKHIANCLYTGIMTDTGSFRFPSTTPKTMRVAAHLLECGAEGALDHVRVYDDNTEGRIRLLGYALSEKLEVMKEFHAAMFTLSHAEHDRFNYQKGDTEGLVNYGLTMRGIVFSAFFAERDGKIKCSFRSKGKFDVNAFARAHFNGGGHRNAAGGMLEIPMEDVVKKFKSILPEYLEKLKKA
jgi:phosphoesterase RecJ-like protein